jgi:hypothetical protein
MNNWAWRDKDGTERKEKAAKKALKKKYRKFNKKFCSKKSLTDRKERLQDAIN